MPIVIGIIAWIFTANSTGSIQLGFYFGAIVTVLCYQERRISALLAQRAKQEVSAPLEALAVREEPVTPAYVEPPPSAPSEEESPPNEVEISVPPLQVTPDSEALFRPTAQILEDIIGPTLAGFILRGNLVARMGVIVLFFGVLFALKLAVENGYLPIELRLTLAALGSFVLLGLGWKIQEKKRQFSITLEGAGMGILYITVFIAFRLYHLIPGPLAFALLFAITALSAVFAVIQDARMLALLAIIGGFLAPALTSEGGGSHILLFSYCALLNLGIFGICLYRSWHALNFTGFFFTVVLGSMWGVKFYTPELFISTELFLLFFLLLFTVNTVLLFIKSSTISAAGSYLTFCPPFFAVILQHNLVSRYEYGSAYSAAGFGLFYLVTNRILFNLCREKTRFLIDAYFMIGLTLLSLAIPFACSDQLTSALWAVEAVALIWSGIRQRHWVTRFLGEVLIVLSSLFFLIDLHYYKDALFFFNPYLFGVALLSVAYLLGAKLLLQAGSEKILKGEERHFGHILSLFAVLWWGFGADAEISRNIPKWYEWFSIATPAFGLYRMPFSDTVQSLFFSGSVLVFWGIGRSWKIPGLLLLRYGLIPLQALLIVRLFEEDSLAPYTIHPFVSFGFVALIAVFLVHYYIIFKCERAAGHREHSLMHQLPLWLGTFVLTWETHWVAHSYVSGGSSWELSTISSLPACVMLLVSSWAQSSQWWPFRAHRESYIKALAPLACWVFLSSLFLDLTSPSDTAPLPYIPLINPLDIAQIISLVALLTWAKGSKKNISAPLAVWLFVWATSSLLRAVHHYGDVPWDVDELVSSIVVQSSLSIFWSILALVLMWTAHNRAWRAVWTVGAVLITVVVAKLFLIDLSSQGSTGRMVAFIGVGLLMLGIGYVAPIPPAGGNKE